MVNWVDRTHRVSLQWPAVRQRRQTKFTHVHRCATGKQTQQLSLQ